MSGNNTATNNNDKTQISNNLKDSFDSLIFSKVFENLDLFMVDSFNVYKSNQNPYSDKELLNKVSKEIKASKLNFFDDIKSMANNLLQVLYTMGNIRDGKDLELYVSQVYNSLSGKIVQIGKTITQESRLNFKDYFNELQILQNTLKDVKSIADEMSKTNRALNTELTTSRTQLSTAKVNLERKTKRCDKLKNTIEEYKNNTQKLVSTVEYELERLKNISFDDFPAQVTNIQNVIKRQSSYQEDLYGNLDASPSRYGDDGRGSRPQSRLASPNRVPEQDSMWFDIENSQKRYEALLDSYQKIINDKDIMVKNIENDLTRSQRQKYDIEEEYQKSLREKEVQITELDLKVSELLFENTKLKSEVALKPLPEIKIEKEIVYLPPTDRTTELEEELKANLIDKEVKLTVMNETEVNLKIKNEQLKLDIMNLKTDLLNSGKKEVSLKKELDEKVTEFGIDADLMKRYNLVEVEKGKAKEQDIVYLEDRVTEQSTQMISVETDLDLYKNQYADLKAVLQVNANDLRTQVQLEQRLRAELNRNINRDLELKKVGETLALQIRHLQKELNEKDDMVAMLKRDLERFQDKTMNLSSALEKINSNKKRSPTKNPYNTSASKSPINPKSNEKSTINSFYPFPIVSTKPFHESDINSSPLRHSQTMNTSQNDFGNMPNRCWKQNR